MTYLRAQRKSRFTRGLPPDALWDLWQQRYPHLILCNDWLYQAVFRGDTSSAAQQAFLDYLHQVCPNPRPDWLNFHLTVEFGDPRKRYESKSKGVYSPPPYTTVRREWWDVLRIDPLSDFEGLKRAYQYLASQVQGDEETLKLLNWAYRRGKQALGIYEWEDIIRGTDAEIKRIGWSTEQARAYLLRTYGKSSRSWLSDGELLAFWDYLKRCDDKRADL